MKWVTILIVDVIVVQASEDLFGNRGVFDFMFLMIVVYLFAVVKISKDHIDLRCTDLHCK